MACCEHSTAIIISASVPNFTTSVQQRCTRLRSEGRICSSLRETSCDLIYAVIKLKMGKARNLIQQNCEDNTRQIIILPES